MLELSPQIQIQSYYKYLHVKKIRKSEKNVETPGFIEFIKTGVETKNLNSPITEAAESAIKILPAREGLGTDGFADSFHQTFNEELILTLF